MALSDWTEQKGGNDIQQSSNQSYEGLFSLYIAGNSNDHVITWDQSGIDQPVEAKVAYRFYFGGDQSTTPPGAVFRYQDNDNYFHCSIRDDGRVRIAKIVGGSTSQLVNSPGTSISNWDKIEWEIYEDSGNNLNVRLVVNGNIRNTWNFFNFLPSGGAVGHGDLNGSHWSGADSGYFDNTEIYY